MMWYITLYAKKKKKKRSGCMGIEGTPKYTFKEKKIKKKGESSKYCEE